MHQPYSWFLTFAQIRKNILSEVDTISFGLKPLMEIIAKVISNNVDYFINLVDSKLALIVGFTLLVAYYFIFSLVRKYLNRIGEKE